MVTIDCLVFVGHFDCLVEGIGKYSGYDKVLIIDKNYRGDRMELGAYYDEVMEVSDTHNKEIMSKCISELLSNKGIKAIYGTNEGVIEVCGYLRERFDIQGMKAYQARTVRDKFLMKEIVAKAGIKTAPVSKVTSQEAVKEFVNKHSYPIVIKPQDGSATQNTFLIGDERELKKVLSKLQYESLPYIMEGYVRGEEYHCDSIVVEGEVIYSTVGKYLTNLINTLGSEQPTASIIYPPNCPSETIQAIKLLNEKAVKAFNVQNAISHLEVFVLDNKEVVFGEIATRIGGGPLIGKCIKYGHNVDIYQAFVDVELHAYQLPKLEDKNKYVGFLAFPTKQGKIVDIATEQEYDQLEGLMEVKILNKIGDEIEDNYNTTKRTGYIILEDNQYEHLKTQLIRLYHEFRLSVEQPRLSISSIYG